MRATESAILLAILLTACGGDGDANESSAVRAGEGMPVARVTTLEDSGPGSLREAVAEGGRQVVFDVSGTIHLAQHVTIGGSSISIDGGSAPGAGITLDGGGFFLEGDHVSDVAIRDVRIRNPRDDGITIKNGAHAVHVEHVSIDGCGDGNIDVTNGSHGVTLAWSLLTGCDKNVLVKYGVSDVTMHHNGFVRSRFRNPFVSGGDDGRLADATTANVYNNLVWGWGNDGGGTGVECGARVNLIGNYYASPGTRSERQANAILPLSCSRGSPGLLHARGNVSGDPLPFDLNQLGNAPEPLAGAPGDAGDACQAAREVLANAGARPRDALDQARLGGISIECTTNGSAGP